MTEGMSCSLLAWPAYLTGQSNGWGPEIRVQCQPANASLSRIPAQACHSLSTFKLILHRSPLSLAEGLDCRHLVTLLEGTLAYLMLLTATTDLQRGI
jgi:hypothetical protein